MIPKESYFCVLSWMVTELKLKGTELIIYAIIYGFSQDGKSYYSGSASYLAEFAGVTTRAVFNILGKLCERNLLRKQEKIVNGIKLVDYAATRPGWYEKTSVGMKKVQGGYEKSSGGGYEKSSYHNIDIDNIEDNKLLTSKPETAPACGAYGPFKPVSLIAKDFQPVDLPEPKAEETAKVEQAPKIGLNAPETEQAVYGVQNEQKNEIRPNFGENSAVVESKSQTEKPKTKKLNKLQEFSNMVLARFEKTINAPEQKAIWFKRNCRCLSDILNYALGDKDLACEMISCTCSFLKEKRLTGGYEAVCRQLPRWYEEALKRKREKESRQFYR